MEQIGVKKRVDHLGRIGIPKEIRAQLRLDGEVELIPTKEGLLIRNPQYVFVKKADMV